MNRNRAFALLLVLATSACAHISVPGSPGPDRDDLWREAHLSLAAENFSGADSLFLALAELHPESNEGREALFYLGAIRMDPRNPAWSSSIAARRLRAYLALEDSARVDQVYRKPEAMAFLELANQLNLPSGNRIPGLQPDTVVQVRPAPGRPRVITSAEETRALAAETERLRRELGERDETIRKLREELNRIRNTLAPGRRPPP